MLGWELPPSITGGLGMACDGLLRGLDEAGGTSVQFMLPSSPASFSGYPPTIRLVELDDGEKSPRPDSSPDAYAGDSERSSQYAIAALNALDSVGDFDLIHAHDWLTFDAALHIKRLTGKPLVVHIHSTEHDRSGYHGANAIITELERKGMDTADRIVAVSHYTKEGLVRNYGQAGQKIDVVYNAGAQAETQPITPNDGCISFIGRITEQKGPEIFVDAAVRIRETVPDARFVMAGDGNLMPMVRSLVRLLGLAGAFSFPGFINRDEVQRLLHRSRVLVMPSLSEPFGLVALEAIQAGVPVVLSRNCGLSERIKSAVYVDPEDVNAIADATIRLLNDPERARERARAASREAARLTWTESARTLQGVYETALQPATAAVETAT